MAATSDCVWTNLALVVTSLELGTINAVDKGIIGTTPFIGSESIMATHFDGCVAVIDDDNDVGDVLEGLMDVMGYSVEIYRSGPEFLREAQFDRLVCLIVDQHMPQMKGLELIERFFSQDIHIPTLLITGTHDPDVEHKAAGLGVMKVLQKPLSHDELLQFVRVSMG